jgi:hypothetical protein
VSKPFIYTCSITEAGKFLPGKTIIFQDGRLQLTPGIQYAIGREFKVRIRL